MKCCDLNSGLLRNKIVIERETITKNNVGGYDSSWSTHLTPFAFIKPLSGSEVVRHRQLQSDISHKIYMRYEQDIIAKDRIKYGTREFQIRAVINIEERDKWLELICVEGPVN